MHCSKLSPARSHHTAPCRDLKSPNLLVDAAWRAKARAAGVLCLWLLA